MSFLPLEQLPVARFEAPVILKQLNRSSRRLAEFKGVVATLPNRNILISTLGLQEAKESSEVENIVTTHDELLPPTPQTARGPVITRSTSSLSLSR